MAAPKSNSKTQSTSCTSTSRQKHSLKTDEMLRREYLRQIEIFELKNSNGAYDAVLEYLREELERLTKKQKSKGDL